MPIEREVPFAFRRLADAPKGERWNQKALVMEPGLIALPSQHHEIGRRRLPKAGGQHAYCGRGPAGANPDRLDLDSQNTAADQVQYHQLRGLHVRKRAKQVQCATLSETPHYLALT